MVRANCGQSAGKLRKGADQPAESSGNLAETSGSNSGK